MSACQMSFKKLKIPQENTKKWQDEAFLCWGWEKITYTPCKYMEQQVEHNGNDFIFVNIEKNWVILQIAVVWEH